jgi:hypothetical protein
VFACGLATGWLPAAAGQEQPPPPPPETRRDYEEEFAETPASRAVDRALGFLQATQQSDGSWISAYGKNTGVTSLCVMAFLGRGHVPGRGPYGATLERAIAWVLAQAKDGFIVRDTSHGPMYSHGIAALMLGEAFGMVNEREAPFRAFGEVYAQAIELILRAQSVPKDRASTGGWRYHPTSRDSDLSCTGWQLLALRAAQANGMPVPRRHIDLAVAYTRRCAHPLGGFTYQPGDEATAARTGTGILSLQICGDFNSPEALRGAEWLVRHPIDWRGPYFFYSVYYCAQAMYQIGGEPWRQWREHTEALLLPRQNADGSWPQPPGQIYERNAGPAYCTAAAALALSVDFKFLPIYQR